MPGPDNTTTNGRKRMKFEKIAAFATKNRTRMAGTYQAVVNITLDNGKTGRGFFTYGYDKRDVTEEKLYVEPHIAQDVAEEIGYDSPTAYSGLIEDYRSFGDMEDFVEYSDAATELVYDMM